MKWNWLLSLTACVGFGLSMAAAAPPELKPEDLPRVPPTEKENALKTFRVKSGFQLQLVAAEPQVVDPIEICFDENGRMFVVEMRDYSEMRDVQPHLGRIRVLEDTDGDGVYEKATIFAENLPWPTGAICYDGGIFVAATPDILFLKDTDGDGKADVRKVIFTGYGAGRDRLNVQALVNCLRWGLDNRIHGQTAGNGGLVKRAGASDDTALSLQGRDFSFDPRTLDLRAENGGGQYGMCFDDHGRKFACSNSRHIMTFMYDARYAGRNPFYNLPSPLVDIPVDGPAAEVFRTSPEEAWRVIRTKWRVSGVVSGIIEGGGRASGYFTSATGISIYRGDAYPDEFLGDAFIADVGSNLIHRKKVRRNGVELLAERPADEQNVEFITSTDLWFRPVEMVNAPDGCLYVCDMYREVIEHPWSLPESIKKLLDLNAGNDRGRIYRIAPDGFKPRKPSQIGKATTEQLVATLGHKNAWHRETAARLIFERRDKAAVPALEALLKKGGAPLGRMHALYALNGLGELQVSHLMTALTDRDANVRAHAVKLSENFKSEPPPQLWALLRQLRNDPDVKVRYQLAFTFGEFDRLGKIEGLTAIAERDFASPWMQAAILSSLSTGAGSLFNSLAANSKVNSSDAGQDFLRQLAILIGAKHDAAEMEQVLAFIDKLDEPHLVFSLARALGDGLQRAKLSFAETGEPAKKILARAVEAAAHEQAPEKQRIEAVQLLAHTSYAESGKLLLGLLDPKKPQALQLAALTTLSRFTQSKVGDDLVKTWDTLSPRVRAETLSVLLARPDRARALLNAIQAGSIRASVLSSTQTKLLRSHSDKSVRQLAERVLSSKATGTRQEVINSFLPALELEGNAAKGKKIYDERCVSCHRLAGEGFSLGPDLITVKTTGREKILVNIIDPNAEVRPEFVAYVVETKDDESLLGLLMNETATTVTLRQAYGKEDVIQRSAITSMKSQGQSIMPEGLEAGLSPQDFADLLEYITSATE